MTIVDKYGKMTYGKKNLTRYFVEKD